MSAGNRVIAQTIPQLEVERRGVLDSGIFRRQGATRSPRHGVRIVARRLNRAGLVARVRNESIWWPASPSAPEEQMIPRAAFSSQHQRRGHGCAQRSTVCLVIDQRRIKRTFPSHPSGECGAISVGPRRNAASVWTGPGLTVRHCSPAPVVMGAVVLSGLNSARLSGSHISPSCSPPPSTVPPSPVAHRPSQERGNPQRTPSFWRWLSSCPRKGPSWQFWPASPEWAHWRTGPFESSVSPSPSAVPDPVSWLASRDTPVPSRHRADAGRGWGARAPA